MNNDNPDSRTYCSVPSAFYDPDEEESLRRILRDQVILDECLATTKESTSYFLEPAVLKLVIQILQSYPGDFSILDDQYLECRTAAQILMHSPEVKRVVVSSYDLLTTLYNCFLRAGVSPLVVTFVQNIFISFLEFDEDQVHDFFAQRPDLTDFALIVIEKPGCLPLLRRLIDLPRSPTIESLLLQSDFCSKVMDRFVSTEPVEIHQNVVDLLRGIAVSNNRTSLLSSEQSVVNQGCLSAKLESKEMIELLVDRMFHSACAESDFDRKSMDSLLINGLSYLYFLLCPSERSFCGFHFLSLPKCRGEDLWDKPVGKHICAAIVPYLSAFKERLIYDQPTQEAGDLSGSLNYSPKRNDTVVSTARLLIVRFIGHLFRARSLSVLREVHRLDLLNTIMDLFFQFPLNSLLHATCEFFVRFVVLNSVQSNEITDWDPTTSMNTSFKSTDALHEALLNSSGSGCVGPPERQFDSILLSTGNVQKPTLFWKLLHQLLVEGRLLERVMETWLSRDNDSRKRGHLGFLRHMSNVLCLVIGPVVRPLVTDPGNTMEPLAATFLYDLMSVAHNGCTTEQELCPELSSYLRSDILPSTWNAWCDFVKGPLAEVNEISRISLVQEPLPSCTSPSALLPKAGSNRELLTDSFQNAYANYCSPPMLSFMEHFGFTEDEFLERQQQPFAVLDAHLSEISLVFHVIEDSDNIASFEHACNQLIMLNGPDVGENMQCLPEDDHILLNESAPTIQPTKRNSETAFQAATWESNSLPSRDQLIRLFSELDFNEGAIQTGETFQSVPYSQRADGHLGTFGFRKSAALTNLNEINRVNDNPPSSMFPLNRLPTTSILPPLTESDAEEICLPDISSDLVHSFAAECSPLKSVPNETAISIPKQNHYLPSCSVSSKMASLGANISLTDHHGHRRPTRSHSALNGYRNNCTNENGSATRSDSLPVDTPVSLLDKIPTSPISVLFPGDLLNRPATRGSLSDKAYRLFDEDIELGDLSSGIPGNQSSRKLFSPERTGCRGTLDTVRHGNVVLPTKRSSMSPSHYTSETTNSQSVTEFQHQESGENVIAHSSNAAVCAQCPLVGDHSTPQKSPPFSSGTIASIKVRRGSKTHKVSAFELGENEVHMSDTIGMSPLTHIEEVSLDDSPSTLEPDPFSDLGLTKMRYRSHRTIRLRPGSDGQLNEAL